MPTTYQQLEKNYHLAIRERNAAIEALRPFVNWIQRPTQPIIGVIRPEEWDEAVKIVREHDIKHLPVKQTLDPIPMDFALLGHGSVWILTPLNDPAQAWCDEHLPEDAQRWGAAGYVIEARYVAAIVAGIREDGFTVS